MKYKLILFFSLLAFIGQRTYAQMATAQGKVKIGDTIPNYVLKDMHNYRQGVRLNDFKGKILILDFWTFGCGTCVASWPKLIKLQEKFKDKIQILLINTYADSKKVKDFIDRRNKIFGFKMTLPVACGDKQLNDLFPHSSVPHLVFVNDSGVVKYITDGNNLHEETIQNMIDHKNMKFYEKTDEYAKINRLKPLFINGNNIGDEVGNDVIWNTIIKPYSPNIEFGSFFRTVRDTTLGWIGNFPIKDMFMVLYGRGMNEIGTDLRVPSARIAFRDVDTAKLVMKVNGIVKYENLYIVQLTSQRKMSVQTIKRKMIDEIEGCFGLKTGWEKQRKKCLVLSRSKYPLSEYKTGEKVVYSSETSVHFNNVTVPEVIDKLIASVPAMLRLSYPIVDETDFNGKLGQIKFESNVIDYHVLNNKLLKYGLELSVQEREVDMLVISGEN